MDSTAMFPEGYHPIQLRYTPDLSRRTPMIPRIGVWPPVKYYFVDFGISSQRIQDEHPFLVLGDLGIDRDVPELSRTVPYDPFKVDIFIAGNMFGVRFRNDSCMPWSINFLKIGSVVG